MLLLMRIKKRDQGSLSRQVFKESRARGWPGLRQEVAIICKEKEILVINDVVVTNVAVKNAI